MKSLFIVFVASAFLFANPEIPTKDISVASEAVSSEYSAAEYIVMEDDIMMNTGTGNGVITAVDIYNLSGDLVLSLSGCGSSSCKFDLSTLSKQSYNVTVNTDTGHSFSGTITLL